VSPGQAHAFGVCGALFDQRCALFDQYEVLGNATPCRYTFMHLSLGLVGGATVSDLCDFLGIFGVFGPYGEDLVFVCLRVWL
jgi:hypothetical protein